MDKNTIVIESPDGPPWSVVISAFCDGEVVDADALAHALAHPEGRAFLVDCAKLRELARQSDGPLPASLASLRRDARWFRPVAVPLPAVAALILVVFLAALLLPRPWMGSGDEPPAPARSLPFEPGVDWHPTR